VLTSDILQLLENEPIGFVDVGARGGVHPLVDLIAGAVAVLGFEPDEAECARMRADPDLQNRYARVDIEPCALADREGTATLHQIVASTNTSLRPTNPTFLSRYNMVKWHEVGQSSIGTTTLDSILFTTRANEPHWGEAIKIDTQGTEHEILIGARRMLEQRTLFACIEVSFCELYIGQKLFAEVELLMREVGLSFYGFGSIFSRSRKSLDKRRYWGRERLFQADAYFFRDPFDPGNAGRSFSRRDTIVLAVFALLAGYHDFGVELVANAPDDLALIRDAIISNASLPDGAGLAQMRGLLAAIEARPDQENVLIGRFVDERRTRNDFYDVVQP
jgi:FkbM family methyltransferase